MKRLAGLAATTIAGWLLLTGCDARSPEAIPAAATHSGPGTHDAAMDRTRTSAATEGYRRSMTDMMKTAPPYSGDADIDFNRQMLVHHKAAVAMAEVELVHGHDPASLALARAVIRAQRAEIAQITAWLARHPG